MDKCVYGTFIYTPINQNEHAYYRKYFIMIHSNYFIFFQGGNRRTRGRRGSSSARGSKPRTGGDPVKFEGEFDFESSNAKFNKEEIEEELQQKLNENLRITDEVNNLCFTCSYWCLKAKSTKLKHRIQIEVRRPFDKILAADLLLRLLTF